MPKKLSRKKSIKIKQPKLPQPDQQVEIELHESNYVLTEEQMNFDVNSFVDLNSEQLKAKEPVRQNYFRSVERS